MTESPDRSGSVLVILDVPPGVEFGIDCITYETGHKFKGLSMVPAGLHFIYHGSGMGDRQGFFVMIENNVVVVKSWDSSQEEILPRHNLSEESLSSLHSALARGELNTFLGPYPFQQHHTWKNITNLITTSVLNRSDCTVDSLLFPGDDSDLLVIDQALDRPERRKTTESEAVKAYFPGTARIARFVDLQRMELELIERIPVGAAKAAAVTVNMLDKSNLLQHLVLGTFGGSWADLLGELQLSFVLFMLLYSHPALHHWKQMVYAICSSERYLQGNPHFTAAYLRVLFSQLNFAPTDFFENELSTQNFLRPSMTALFASLSGPQMDASLLEHKKRLRTFIQKKFNLYETEVFASEGAGGQQTRYEEEDLYNISEEDLPTFVSAEELQQLQQFSHQQQCQQQYSDQQHQRGSSSASIGAEEYQAAAISLEAVGSMHLGGHAPSAAGGGGAGNVFLVRDHRSATADGTTREAEAFQSRWAQIDSALNVSPSRQSSTGASEDIAVEATEDLLGRLADSSFQQAQQSTSDQHQSRRNHGYNIGCAESKEDAHSHPPPSLAEPARAPAPAAMSPAEREAALFSWRYPLLFESMALTAGREDMLMAAMRVLEEGGGKAKAAGAPVGKGSVGGRDQQQQAEASIAELRYKEAQRFVEYEVGRSS